MGKKGSRSAGKKAAAEDEEVEGGGWVATAFVGLTVLCALAFGVTFMKQAGAGDGAAGSRSAGPSRAELAAAARPQRRGDAVGPADAGNELLAWASAADGFVVNVALKQFKVEGRGLATKKPIKKGEILMFIPDEYMIGINTSNVADDTSRYATVAANLLAEADKGEASIHYHYIRALPSVDNGPNNIPSMSPTRKALKQAFADGLGEGTVVHKRIYDGLNCAEETVKLLGGKDGPSKQILETSPRIADWACSIVMSREFSVKDSLGGELWPIHDMKNNNLDPGSAAWKKITKYKGVPGHGIQATRAYKKGEQIYEHCELPRLRVVVRHRHGGFVATFCSI